MKAILFFLMLVLMLPVIFRSATYYVSPQGNNSNPGTFEAPWASPGYGSKHIQTGDTLMILGGTYIVSQYWDDMITPPSGTPSQPTIIEGQPGNRPVIKGTDNLSSAIDISETSNIKIYNLEITSVISTGNPGLRDGIAGTGLMNNIIIKGVYIHSIDEFGINLQDIHNLTLKNSQINYCGYGSIGGPEAGPGGGWQNVLIENCSLSYGGHYYQGQYYQGTDVSPYNRPDGFGIEESPGPIIIRDCIAERNLGDGLDSKAKNTSIYNCIVRNNNCDGIKLWSGESRIENCLIYGTGYDDPLRWPWACSIVVGEYLDNNSSFYIENVTVEDNPNRDRHYIIWIDTDEEGITNFNVTMRNSIIANGRSVAYFGDKTSAVIQNSLFHIHNQDEQVYANGQSYTREQINSGQLQSGNISLDPMFKDPYWYGGHGNYTLEYQSPAIDAGMDNGLINDINYTPRPYGTELDMGCFEMGNNAVISIDNPSFNRLFLYNYRDNWSEMLQGVSARDIMYADINGDRIPEFIFNLSTYGIYSYNQLTGAWNNLLPQPAGAITVARTSAGVRKEIIASFNGLGIFRYNPVLGNWIKILNDSACIMTSGNLYSDADNIDALLVVFDNAEGLFSYDFKSGLLKKIISAKPSWVLSRDLDADGITDIIISVEGAGIFTGKYIKLLESFQLTKIIGIVPDEDNFLWTGDIAGDDRSEIIICYNGKTYYYSLETLSWSLLLNGSFIKIINGDFEGTDKDCLLMTLSSTGSLYLRHASGLYQALLSGAWAKVILTL